MKLWWYLRLHCIFLIFIWIFLYLQTAEALLYDAVSLVAKGVEALLEKDTEHKAAKGKEKDLRTDPLALAQLDCNRSAHWEHGKALLEAIKGVKGITC